MLSERLQIVLSPDQWRRWEAEARRRGISVASLIRDAVDRDLRSVDRPARIEAVGAIGEMRGRFLTIHELDRVVEEERGKARRR
jgi:hypothetical protein